MKKYIDKPAIENILHKLWKKDTGYENIDIARIAYNRALQDVQKAIDSKQEEPVSEELGEIIIEGANFNKSWYAHPELAFKAGANRKKEQIEEVLLSEVLPCFMHGGEADEVVAKLDEVLNEKE